MPNALSSKIYDGREPLKYKLMSLFMAHQDRFEKECKQKLFEFCEEVLEDESMKKYDKLNGQAKLNFLALNKKSQKKLINAYFRSE